MADAQAAEAADEMTAWMSSLRTMLSAIQVKRSGSAGGVTVLKEGWADLKDEAGSLLADAGYGDASPEMESIANLETLVDGAKARAHAQRRRVTSSTSNLAWHSPT